ncbi:hypothetical protein KM043_009582 [Ampulex compressa]|nr:hypothetical protein KM043_009582 [Ampulex compressa]
MSKIPRSGVPVDFDVAAFEDGRIGGSKFGSLRVTAGETCDGGETLDAPIPAGTTDVSLERSRVLEALWRSGYDREPSSYRTMYTTEPISFLIRKKKKTDTPYRLTSYLIWLDWVLVWNE